MFLISIVVLKMRYIIVAALAVHKTEMDGRKLGLGALVHDALFGGNCAVLGKGPKKH